MTVADADGPYLIEWRMGWLFPFRLRETAIVERLEMSAFEPLPADGYLVGGAVRDALLGNEPSDLDWLVAEPEAEARRMASRVGGTAFPLDEERGHWRVLSEDSSVRTRDYIALKGGLDADLRTRDFTVNALAAKPDGHIVDPCGGLPDLRRRLLRMTSAEALRADPLRLLRGPRLALQLKLRIEAATRKAIRRFAEDLRLGELPFPAWERIREELDAVVSAPAPGKALVALDELGLLDSVLPELARTRNVEQGGFHHLDVLGHSLEALQRLVTIFPEADLTLRWATLMHDVGKPDTRERGEDGRIHFHGHDRRGAEITRSAMRRIRRSSADSERTAALVRYHMLPLPAGERQARRFVHRRRELLPDLLKLMIADREAARGRLSSEATRRAYRMALSRVLAILEEAPPPAQLLDGHEVMDLLGLPEGPEVGEALRFLSEARAVGDVADRRSAVLALEHLALKRGWRE